MASEAEIDMLAARQGGARDGVDGNGKQHQTGSE